MGHLVDHCSEKVDLNSNSSSKAPQDVMASGSKIDDNKAAEQKRCDDMFGPWQVINRKKKPQSRKFESQEGSNKNRYEALKEVKTDGHTSEMTKASKQTVMNSMKPASSNEKEIHALHGTKFTENKSTEMIIDCNLVNEVSDFNDPISVHGKGLVFQAEKLESIPIQFNSEKNLELLHNKLSDTFAITVNRVIDSGDLTIELWDNDSICSSLASAGKTRKAVSQIIHHESFPFLPKQNRAKKKRLETHLDDVLSEICIRKFGSDWDGVFMPGDGRSNGIVLVWMISSVKISLIHKCKQAVHVSVSSNGNLPWLLTGIYASTTASERELFWNYLADLNKNNTPRLLMGDFNCIEKQEDKKGGRDFCFGKAKRSFNSLKYEAGLIDLGFTGPRYTWCNNRYGDKRVMTRIDRFYANDTWISIYSHATVFHMKKLALDHRPIMLDTMCSNKLTKRKKRFVFELYWLEKDSITQLIKENWGKGITHGDKACHFDTYLSSLIVLLSVFGAKKLLSL
ncbi:hypothetical protein Cni_G07405 [Canna indica]|uniref:Endonuclease/exonuclease/phosphatase domain-containing protein n=1 Tax=Canna indica TaxID=4628 RepID=A0AAQ3Q5Q0_9LILI|nr:hypothetical protein Cni_G07405 [Canna indica]